MEQTEDQVSSSKKTLIEKLFDFAQLAVTCFFEMLANHLL